MPLSLLGFSEKSEGEINKKKKMKKEVCDKFSQPDSHRQQVNKGKRSLSSFLFIILSLQLH